MIARIALALIAALPLASLATAPVHAAAGGICMGPNDPRGCYCKMYPDRKACKAPEAATTVVQPDYSVTVDKPKLPSYSRDGNGLQKGYSDFSGAK